MKKQLPLLIIVFFTFTSSLFADSYNMRVVQSGAAEIDFIFPPGTEQGFKKSKQKLKLKYGCHAVEISALSHANYYASLEKVNEATYRLAKNGECAPEAAYTIVPTGQSDSLTILIIINYEHLFQNAEGGLPARFDDLAIKLLTNLSEMERADQLAPSISQNIVEKIFELSPTPLKSSLSRFGAKRGGQSSMILLNPNFAIQVDNVSQVTWGNPMGNHAVREWQMSLMGQSRVSFHRNEKGFITQIPFIISPLFPDNKLIEGQNKELLASSGDLQFSAATRTDTYFAVVNHTFRTNNSSGGGLGNCYPSDSDRSPPNWTNCNFMIVSSKTFADLLNWESCASGDSDFSKSIARQIGLQREALKALADKFEKSGNRDPEPIRQMKALSDSLTENEKIAESLRTQEQKVPRRDSTDCSAIHLSVFGARNLIVPVFSVWVNGNLKDVMVGSGVNDLSIPLTRNLEVRRLYRGEYIKVKGVGSKLILLPGDKIKF